MLTQSVRGTDADVVADGGADRVDHERVDVVEGRRFELLDQRRIAVHERTPDLVAYERVVSIVPSAPTSAPTSHEVFSSRDHAERAACAALS